MTDKLLIKIADGRSLDPNTPDGQRAIGSEINKQGHALAQRGASQSDIELDKLTTRLEIINAQVADQGGHATDQQRTEQEGLARSIQWQQARSVQPIEPGTSRRARVGIESGGVAPQTTEAERLNQNIIDVYASNMQTAITREIAAAKKSIGSDLSIEAATAIVRQRVEAQGMEAVLPQLASVLKRAGLPLKLPD